MNSEQEFSETTGQQGSQGNAGENAGESGGYEVDEDGQRIPHGMGQSKSSRRRRRKRKGKGSEAGSPTAEGMSVGSSEADPGAGGNDGEVVGNMHASAAPGGESQGGFTPAGQAVAQIHAGSPGQSARGGFRQNNVRGSQSGQGGNAGQNGGGAQSSGSPQNGVGAPGGTKRWKKKFRDRDRSRPQENAGSQGSNHGSFAQGAGTSQAPQNTSGGGFRGPDTHQPGNGGGFKRKGGFGGGSSGGGKQRGPRGGFVGPMDHSYRAVNGNFMETPPSTMEPRGNYGGGGGRPRTYQGDSQPIDYSQGRAIPIAEGAPTKIYFFIEDLFFTAKIQETARKLGVKIAFIKNDKESIAALTSGEDEDRPGLIVFDLNNANAKPLTLIPKLKAKLKKATSIIGFLSHLQGDLKAKAVDAGCDTVMPRAAFSQNLPNLLRRYGIEDTEEQNFNQ